MTLKQEEAIKNLPNTGFNISKAMRQAGYTEQGSRAGNNYARLRAILAKRYNPDELKAEIVKYERLFLKNKDFSNLARMVELRAKILGLTKEHSNTQVSVFTGDMIKDLPPIAIDTDNRANDVIT